MNISRIDRGRALVAVMLGLCATAGPLLHDYLSPSPIFLIDWNTNPIATVVGSCIPGVLLSPLIYWWLGRSTIFRKATEDAGTWLKTNYPDFRLSGTALTVSISLLVGVYLLGVFALFRTLNLPTSNSPVTKAADVTNDPGSASSTDKASGLVRYDPAFFESEPVYLITDQQIRAIKVRMTLKQVQDIMSLDINKKKQSNAMRAEGVLVSKRLSSITNEEAAVYEWKSADADRFAYFGSNLQGVRITFTNGKVTDIEPERESSMTWKPRRCTIGLICPHADILEASIRKDYDTQLKLLHPLIAKGDAHAQYILGTLYDDGTGVRQDYKEAARLYGLAARQGDARAQVNLGTMHANGQGVAQDAKEAARLFRLAAAQGYPIAQFNLGTMYADGQGVAQDSKEAARLFRLAAAQGEAQAQGYLGTMYYSGEGVEQDYKEAARLYGSAAAKGNAFAQFSLGSMYEGGLGVTQDYKEAARLYGLAAVQGEAQAQSNLGVMYVKGHGVARNYVRAHMWFNLGAISGYKNASSNRDRIAAKMTPAQIAEAQAMARTCQASNFKQCD